MSIVSLLGIIRINNSDDSHGCRFFEVTTPEGEELNECAKWDHGQLNQGEKTWQDLSHEVEPPCDLVEELCPVWVQVNVDVKIDKLKAFDSLFDSGRYFHQVEWRVIDMSYESWPELRKQANVHGS